MSRRPTAAASAAVCSAVGAVVLAACSAAPAAAPLEPVAPSGASASTTTSGSAAPQPDQEPSVDPVLACVARLPLEVRIGQTMLVTTTDTRRVQEWLDDGLIAGILSNGRLTSETAAALDEATTGGTYGALLAADEEGGQVQRYTDVIGPIPSARQQATSMTPDEVRDMYAGHGAALADWGVDLVFAPVVDVGFGPGIGSRSYSDDPQVVAEFGAAAAQGYADAGLLPVLKHFPGHGGATGDTHDEVSVGPAIDELRAHDLLPFQSIGEEVDVAVMVGHTTVPGHADELSSQSRRVIEGLLVDEVGFDGLIVSDALGMEASGEPTQGGALEDRAVSEDRLNDAAAAVLAAKGIDPCDVASGPTPQVQDTEVPDDPAVVNPTQEP